MLQQLYAFLARAPARTGITLAVGDAGPAPGTAGLWCKGVTVLEQRENLLGTVRQRCRAEFTLRLCLPLPPGDSATAAENAAQIHDADVCAYGDSCHAVSFSRIVFVPRDVRSERVFFKRGAKHNGTVRFVGLACRRINLNLRQICAVAESVLAQRNKIFGKRNFSQSRAAVESARCDFELHRLSVSEKLNRSQIGTVPESV